MQEIMDLMVWNLIISSGEQNEAEKAFFDVSFFMQRHFTLSGIPFSSC